MSALHAVAVPDPVSAPLPASVLLGSVLLVSSPAPGKTGPVVPTSSAAAVDGGNDVPATGPATDAAPDAAVLGISPESAEHQAELVRGEDARLVDVRVAETNRPGPQHAQPFRVRSAGLYTLVLTPRRNAYTLGDLRVPAPQTFLLQPDGSYLLREHILVEAGATLAVTPQRPTTIKLASGVDGFVSIVAHGGRLRLLGTAAPLTIRSWDTTAGRPDDKLDDGRAYVRAMGQLIARHTSFAQLGFWSGRTGGVAMIGSQLQVAQVDPAVAKARAAGVSSSRRQTPMLPAGALPSVDGTADVSPGEVSDCTMDGNAFGLFVSARGVEGTVVTQSVSRGNGRDGMVIAGSPLAAGPSAGGESTRPFGNNVLSTNQVEANRRSGVRWWAGRTCG